MSREFVNPFGVNVGLSPDMDAIHSALVSKVTNDGDIERIWTDLITAATGSYALRMVSSFTADLAFAVERAQQEGMLYTARRPSSIYAITKNHGVHLRRKIPGNIEVRLSRSSTTNVAKRIPEYSQWTVGDVYYFNRDAIIFPEGQQYITTSLQRGTVQEDIVYSNGSANQSFIIDIPGFRVSDIDLFCDIDGLRWRATREGIWETTPLSKVFYEHTTTDGKPRLHFGDGVYGAIPRAGEISVKYVIVQTSDYDAAKDLNPIAIGSVVTCGVDTAILGVVSGETQAIQTELPAAFYQRNAPYIASGRKRANTRKNLRALALEYPGVIDARLLGQAEINPKDLRWMNGIAVYLLTDREWGTVSWNQFVQYMHRHSDSTRHFYRRDPSRITVDYTINIMLSDRAHKDLVESKIKETLSSIYALSDTSLGARYDKTNIGKRILDKARDPYGNLITYMEIAAPNDIKLLPTQYAVLGNVTVNNSIDRANMVRVVEGVSVPGGRIGVMG